MAASLREHARNLPQLLNQAVEAVATIRADAIYAANRRACEYLDVGHPARHRDLIEWAVLLGGRTATGGPIGGERPRQVALAKALANYPLRPGWKAASEPTDADHAAGAIWMIVEEANNRIVRARVDARKAIRQLCAALGVAFEVEVQELIRRNAPNGDKAMPQGSWYVVRDADSVAVCACSSQESARSVCDAIGPGFTAKQATGGEWLRWDREIAAADSRIGQADNIFASSELDGYTNDDVEAYQIQHFPEHADRVRAARYLSILLNGADNQPAVAPTADPTPAPATVAAAIKRPDFHLTTDIRATSDPLWRDLAAFRRRLMEFDQDPPAGCLLLDIRLGAHAAGLFAHGRQC